MARLSSTTPALAALLLGAALPAQGFPNVQAPSGNPITPEKALLGKALFWDEQLSSTGTVSCGTCHVPSAGTSDPRSDRRLTPHPGPDGIFGNRDDRVGSPGVVRQLPDGTYVPSPWGARVQVTPRKSPGVINAAFAPSLFWDGRATDRFVDPVNPAVVVLPSGAALESQAAGPPVSDSEMAHIGQTWPQIAQRIAGIEPLALATNIPAPLAAFLRGASYPDLFERAFGSRQVTPRRIVMAIATYERTLVSADSAFDRGPLSPAAQRGLWVFEGRGDCARCHPAPEFTDHAFHDIGVRPASEDPGLGGFTGDPADNGKFRTPTLRNVELRSPYLNNGRFRTLRQIVDFYDRGGDFPNPELTPLGLTRQEKDDLVAFMEALTDDRVAQEMPPFDRPTLYSERVADVPQPYGQGTAGSGGFVPYAVAPEPPTLGNPHWTVGLGGAPGGRSAFLMLDGAAAPAGGTRMLGIDVLLGMGPGFVAVGPVALSGTAPGEGVGSLSFTLPTDPMWTTTPLYGQWLTLDPANPAGLGASDGFTWTHF